ncbi:hypothetical protein LCGC14_0897340 [marine sediment metagenome]|uniref:Uncharacterized protein n=1 Tax=marine sediment metagenome TaxID=412755 RepID=A0A0F9S4B1_9ZZZZ
MPFYYVASGTNLYKVNTSGTLTTLSLPTGVSMVTTRRARFAMLNQRVIMVNGATRNIWIDPIDDTVRPLAIQPPVTPPLAVAGSSGNLTGTYKVKLTFGIKDSDGKLLLESALGPASDAVAITSKKLKLTGVSISDDSEVNVRRTYRTVAGGNIYFEWIDLDGNTSTDMEDDLSDAGLNLLPQPRDLGSPEGTSGINRLRVITSWKDRLWAAGSDAIDTVVFTGSRKLYAWPVEGGINIPQLGEDDTGITGFAARRDVLGVSKRDSLHMITGNSPSDFRRVTVAQGPGTGFVAPDSIVIIGDVAYGLGENGVNRWDDTGVETFSNDKAKGWFTTDDTFNRSQFSNAVGAFDPSLRVYRLGLSATGSTDIDRWVDYYIDQDVWLGPHKTGALTGAWLGLFEDSNDLALPILGDDSGFLYTMNNSTQTDGADTAIDFDVDLPFFSMNSPDIEKHFGQPTIVSKVESGGTLTITPKTGGLDASAGSDLSHDLTTGRELLDRLGQGRFVQLRLRQNTNAQGVELYGIEIPFHELGRR